MNDPNPYSAPAPKPVRSSIRHAANSTKIPFSTYTSGFARLVFTLAALVCFVCFLKTSQNIIRFTATDPWFEIIVSASCLLGFASLLALIAQKQTFDEAGIHTWLGPFRTYRVNWSEIQSWDQTFPDAWAEIRKTDGRLLYLNSLGSRQENPMVGEILFEILGPSNSR